MVACGKSWQIASQVDSLNKKDSANPL